MKKMRVLLCTIILASLLLPPLQSLASATTIEFIEGVVNDPVVEQETEFFSNLVLTGELDARTHVYDLRGSAKQQGRYTGEMSGTYDTRTGVLSGNYFYGLFIGETDIADETYTFEGTFKGSVDQYGKCKLTLQGTQTWTKFNWERDAEGMPIYELGIEEENTTDSIRNVTFNTDLSGGGAASGSSAEKVADSGVRFSGIGGQVEVCIPVGYDENGKEDYGDETWEFAEYGMVLPYGTAIRQQEDSYVLLSFPDMTTFETEKEGTIILSGPPEKESQFQILYGNLKGNVKQMLKDGSMQIEMSQAVAGIKGTTFVLNEDGTTSTLKVIEGSVEFTAKADGRTETVNAGEMLSATANGMGEKQAFDTAAELAAWEIAAQTATPQQFPWLIVAGIGAAVLAAAVLLFLFLRKKHAKTAKQAVPAEQLGFCIFCGNALESDAAFCDRCGKKVE